MKNVPYTLREVSLPSKKPGPPPVRRKLEPGRKEDDSGLGIYGGSCTFTETNEKRKQMSLQRATPLSVPESLLFLCFPAFTIR